MRYPLFFAATALFARAPDRVQAQSPQCADADLITHTLRYCLAGSGPVTVVLEAGLEGGLAAWDSIAPRITRFARVVSYDRAGHGASRAVALSRSPAALADELERMLDVIGVGPPWVVVALGDGGHVARALTSRRPDAVRGIVLIDAPHPGFATRQRALFGAQARVLDSIRSAVTAALPPAARTERAAIDSLPADPRPSFPDSIALAVVTAARHEWPSAARTDLQERLWRDTQRELSRTARGGEWVVIGGDGPGGLLARPDSIVAVIERTVTRATHQKSILRRVNEGWELVKREGGVVLLAGLILLGWIGQQYVSDTIKARRERQKAAAAAAPADRHLIPLARLLRTSSPSHSRAARLIAKLRGRSSTQGPAVRLLAACNEKARLVYRARMAGTTATDADAESMWSRTWEARDWDAQRSFIEPVNSGRGPQKYAAAVIRGWLEEYATTNAAARDRCEVWLRAAAGAGKSTLMGRLFFELIGATDPAEDRRPVPEPMLLQPRNIELSDQATGLRTSSDAFGTLVTYWLENRRIAVPEAEKAALIADFRFALERGKIVLLIDGHDDLRRMKLGAFLEDLRKTAHCWVAAERDDPDAPGRWGRREVNLASGWSLPEIEAHLARRWRPGHRHHAEVTRVNGILASETDAEHWLRIPRNLDLYLSHLENEAHVPDDGTLRGHCAGQAELIGDLCNDAINRLEASEMGGRINWQLCHIAANQVLGADLAIPPSAAADGVWQQIARLTDLVERTSTGGAERIRFRSPAFRDFYLAGQIALDLANPDHGGVTLGQDRWGRSLLVNISHWLGRLKKGAADVGAWIPRWDAPLDSRASGGSRRDPSPLTTEPTPAVAPAAAVSAPNLLHLLIRVELDRLRRARPAEGEWDLRREVKIHGYDWAGIGLDDDDIRLLRFDGCRFDGGSFANANLQHAAFTDCSFRGADFTQADVVGAEFLRCRFRDPDRPGLKVEGLQIESTMFGTRGSADACDVDPDQLAAAGAVRTRSRYRGAFGRLFLNDQEKLLGPDLIRLETEAYRERIHAAIARAEPDRPIYLIDLMAGGGSDRLTVLLADQGKNPNLHVLGVDRDDPALRALKRAFPYRFEGRQWEIGAPNESGASGPLHLDLAHLLGDAFGSGGERLLADVIIAKKALHELERALQPELFRECHRALRPGGSFVLFADTPGTAQGGMSAEQFRWLDREIRPLLMNAAGSIEVIRQRVLAVEFTGSAGDQATFANLWTLLKDWANDNTHEVANRYFASVAEIIGWARDAGLEPGQPALGHYQIAVARFNEAGIRQAMHHLERQGAADADEAALREWLSGVGQPRFALLREYTEHHLADGRPLAAALSASTEEIRFDRIHPQLRSIRQRSRTFQFPVNVIDFRKPG